jgi:hypothetical protein
MQHAIELELRAEISPENIPKIQEALTQLGQPQDLTKRLSVMMFGQVNNTPLDIRIRVTNGKCEVVSKAGVFGSHNRTEAAAKILPNEFLSMVKVFSQLDFESKIGEREQQDFALPNGVTATIVKAQHLAYLELEKLSSLEHESSDLKLLEDLGKQLGLNFIATEDEFQELISRLNTEVDWQFSHTTEDYTRLESLLDTYL